MKYWNELRGLDVRSSIWLFSLGVSTLPPFPLNTDCPASFFLCWPTKADALNPFQLSIHPLSERIAGKEILPNGLSHYFLLL